MFNTLLVHPLFNLLAVIYALVPGHDFGVAVIILTVLVRILLWPVITKQLHSQKAMQQLAPEVARVRKEAAGDRQKESQMLMELYKERQISPFASLIPVLVQLPLLIALFVVLRDIIKPGEIAHLAYGPVKDLAAIKTVINDATAFKTTLFGVLNLAKPNLILAAVAAVLQFGQTKMLLPKSTGGDPNAQAGNLMAYIFPFLTFLIALRLPAALPLYWVVTSLIAVFQQRLILNQDVVELEGGKAKKGGK